MTLPKEIAGQKYISLTTFRKSGAPVATPVWFGEQDGKLYVMTRSDSGKYKRIRNNAAVRLAPCTIRGKVPGPDFGAVCKILPKQDWPHAKATLTRKYWLARLPLWSEKNVFLAIENIRP